MLTFFFEEKNFNQEQESNNENGRWICKEIEEVPALELFKVPSSVMALGIISNKGNVMPPYFFPNNLRVTAENNQYVVSNIVKPWTDKVADKRPPSSSKTRPSGTTLRRSSCGFLATFPATGLQTCVHSLILL